MKLYIPKISDELKLLSDWKFKLHFEYRNSSLYPKYSNYSRMDNPTGVDYTLIKDTILIIDRLYIRKGAPDFDSITFRISFCPNKDLIKKRFWVKLDDANNIEFEKVSYTKSVKMNWSGWLDAINTRIETYPLISAPLNTNSKCYVDNDLRFIAELKFETAPVTEENWQKFKMDTIYLGYNDVTKKSTYDTLEEYIKYYLMRWKIQTWFKSSVDFSNSCLYRSWYILTDLKHNKEYEFNSSKSLKQKARKILNEELKNHE